MIGQIATQLTRLSVTFGVL